MKRVASGILPMIAINRRASKPLHWQIYEAYRTSIVDGSLRPGQRIPSTRVLASELGVSRFPVLNAYAQLLAEGGCGLSLPPTRANRHVKGSSWGLAVPNWRTFPAPSASSVACSHESSGQRHSFNSISHP
jgi:DNA-binding transcriptional MocR family regulator